VEATSNLPLPVTDGEVAYLDLAINRMASLSDDRGIMVDSLMFVNTRHALCRKIDMIIAETLRSIISVIPDNPAEKLFERLMAKLDGPCESKDRPLGIILVRFLDTMEYMVSLRGIFRGVDKASTDHEKKIALRVLGMRGLTKK